MRRALAALLVVATLTVAASVVAAPVAGAQDEPTTTFQPAPSPDIIPEPNSGAAPRDENDRGGWAQYAVLIGIVVGLGVIVLLVARESRRKRQAQGDATSTRSEPVADTSSKRPDSSARQ